jgi:excinuclease UvrABC nuclease subunit
MAENKGKSGIYCWKNIQNGKKYVGSAIDLAERLYIYYNVKRLNGSKMAIYNTKHS